MGGSSFALQKDGGLLLVKSCHFVNNYDIYIFVSGIAYVIPAHLAACSIATGLLFCR